MAALTKRDYALALQVQDACNLSGVVHSLSAVLPRIREDNPNTDAVNTHPITRLYAGQIGHLSGMGMGNADTYHTAYTACVNRAESEGIEALAQSLEN